MVDDDLERRAVEPVEVRDAPRGRIWEVLAVGLAWSVPGVLVGLLAAAIAAAWPGTAAPIGVLGGLVGAIVGILLEATRAGD